MAILKKISFLLFCLGLILTPAGIVAGAETCCVCSYLFNGEPQGPDKVQLDDNGELITDPGQCVDFNESIPIGAPPNIAGYQITDCSVKLSYLCVPDKPIVTKLPEVKFSNIILGVRIPNLRFSPPPTEVDENGNIYIPWIGEYIKALYNFSMVAISVVAVVVIIVQGLRITASGGGPAKSEAFKKIGQAVIGLLLAWGSYVILFAVNPELLELRSLDIKFIDAIVIDYEPNEVGLSDSDEARSSIQGNPALVAISNSVAEKLGINPCLFAAQIAKESGWKVSGSTSCCHGLGQVSLANAKEMLNGKQRSRILSIHSQGCPNCPGSGASDTEIINWLNSDAEGNLILSGIIRKNALQRYNAVAAAIVYNMGPGTYKNYIQTSGCRPQNIDEDTILSMLKEGSSNEEILKISCIPPTTWPIAKKGFTCPGSNQCCASPTGDCTRPGFTPSGRAGYCRGGERDGKKCFTGGSIPYASSYINTIRNCVK